MALVYVLYSWTCICVCSLHESNLTHGLSVCFIMSDIAWLSCMKDIAPWWNLTFHWCPQTLTAFYTWHSLTSSHGLPTASISITDHGIWTGSASAHFHIPSQPFQKLFSERKNCNSNHDPLALNRAAGDEGGGREQWDVVKAMEELMEFCVHFGCDSMEKEEKTNDPLGEVWSLEHSISSPSYCLLP